jgi:hypothetical protein
MLGGCAPNSAALLSVVAGCYRSLKLTKRHWQLTAVMWLLTGLWDPETWTLRRVHLVAVSPAALSLTVGGRINGVPVRYCSAHPESCHVLQLGRVFRPVVDRDRACSVSSVGGCPGYQGSAPYMDSQPAQSVILLLLKPGVWMW